MRVVAVDEVDERERHVLGVTAERLGRDRARVLGGLRPGRARAEIAQRGDSPRLDHLGGDLGTVASTPPMPPGAASSGTGL